MRIRTRKSGAYFPSVDALEGRETVSSLLFGPFDPGEPAGAVGASTVDIAAAGGAEVAVGARGDARSTGVVRSIGVSDVGIVPATPLDPAPWIATSSSPDPGGEGEGEGGPSGPDLVLGGEDSIGPEIDPASSMPVARPAVVAPAPGPGGRTATAPRAQAGGIRPPTLEPPAPPALSTGSTAQVPVIVGPSEGPVGVGPGPMPGDGPLGMPSPSDLSTSNSLLVKFQPSVSATTKGSILGTAGAVVKSLSDGTDIVGLTPGADAAAVQRRLASDPRVLFAELNAVAHAEAAPNDPNYGAQTGLSDLNDIDIDAPQAWNFTTGSPSSVVVAVIDTGIDLQHPDLVNQIWVNPSPDPVGGQHPGDLHGWNFVSNTSNVQDDNGHGTAVSGIIGAQTNNGIGVAGVAQNARIMALKALDSNGNGFASNLASAIVYAVDHGAKVINASWELSGFSAAVQSAIAYAGAHEVAFVAAAGNGSSNLDVTPVYPASYNLSNMLSVAAVDDLGGLAGFSNYGGNTVHLGAPGVTVETTLLGGSYGTQDANGPISGTSFAAPFVAGTVALVASLYANPLPYPAQQLVLLTQAMAKPLASLQGKTTSDGIVDALNAVRALPTYTRSDVNGDGFADFNLYNPPLATFRTDLNGGGASYVTTFGGTISWTALMGDMNADGRGDIIVYNPSTTTFHWSLTTANGVVNTNPQGSQQFGNGTWRPFVADFNGDGRSDVAMYNPSTTTLSWMLTNSNGTAGSGTQGSLQFGNGTRVPFVADMNGDGRADFAMYDRNTTTLNWMLTNNLGTGGSGTQGSLQFGNGTRVPFVADMNGDGRADFAMYDQISGTLNWALTNSAGTGWNGPQDSKQFGSNWLTQLLDMNHDGMADIVQFNASTSTFHWVITGTNSQRQQNIGSSNWIWYS
jgi:subtilisin family serine protease